ncbi:MFS transporter [Corynebacterium alimapuense]|uniref:MFS transporter n=1 Tax=Corynebacterium alimapuense TaxID=1576874 RepID=A0A3M8K5E2_9CORY|nr:MFS transporter [Corynebacterium alimapuense]RNE48443.1 MFS transporter [Corynebacterium alimapuense]
MRVMTKKQRSATPTLPTEIWVLVAAAFIIALGYGLVAPIIPQFAVSFDVSMAAAGAVISIFAASRLVFAPVSGRLVDALGSRKVYLTGLLTVAIATALVAGAQAYWHILLLRGIAGIGSTMFTVSAMGLIVKLAPPSGRGRASAVYGTAFLVGNVIGPVIGAVLSTLGMRAPFVIYGVAVAMAAFVVWWKMPRHTDNAGLHRNTQPPLTFRVAIRDSAYRSILVSGFAHGWINFGVRVATLPLFAAAIFHHGGAIAGLAMAAFAAGNAVMLQFSGRLADTIGRKPMVMTGLVVNAVFTGALGFSEGYWSLLILSALAGAGSGLLNPAQQAVLADVIGRERSGGKVLANFQMSQDLGAITGPIIIGMVAQAYGFQVGFLLCGVIGLVAAAVWSLGRESLEVNPVSTEPAS